ncbi:PACE efflux transporter [Aquabacterium sp. OR-4]|uniref:PACE efflux transporter n=1 Tax=Aquabacterium sp. OR-4 TaxID=2978127 RepID=UPI0028C514C0|nr:PACE efflux transporter [Aquabacterium sp. OR-4]MDT7838793.1 PACE efflux transporter [Aquabacterium sp. OR-4]
MQPRTRRVLQAVLYEFFAIVAVGPVLAWLFAQPLGSTLGLAVLMSTVALAWNYLFNGWFERWESRQPVKGRNWRRRLAHGLGFEGGLVVMLVPVMAWWLNTTLLQALLADLGVLVFFFGYAVVFTWAFDRVFGLPASAAPVAAGADGATAPALATAAKPADRAEGR